MRARDEGRSSTEQAVLDFWCAPSGALYQQILSLAQRGPAWGAVYVDETLARFVSLIVGHPDAYLDLLENLSRMDQPLFAL